METFTDDTVVALASFLSPHDILSLALSCKRFGTKHMEKIREEGAVQSLETHNTCNNISLMEVAVRRVLHAKWTDEEKAALPRHGDESWIGIYQEFLVQFRMPLQFDKLVGEGISYVESTDKTKVCTNRYLGDSSATAICSNIMRAGKHSASFQINDDSMQNGARCGIMRPTTNDITSLNECSPVHDDLSRFSLKEYEMLYGDDNFDCCMLDSNSLAWKRVRRMWKEWIDLGSNQFSLRMKSRCKVLRWTDRARRIDGPLFTIRLLLDLDEGTLDVYQNERHLGTMMTGLVGEYCWAVTLYDSDGVNVFIRR